MQKKSDFFVLLLIGSYGFSKNIYYPTDIYKAKIHMNHNKQIGYQNEKLVLTHYLSEGYTSLKKNYTIPGGEIDLLVLKNEELVLVEVKTVNHIDELDNYITQKKISFLQKTLESFLLTINDSSIKEIRMDVAFVKDNKIIEIFENISNS